MDERFREIIDGEDFYRTIVEMGEEITFLTDPEIKQFASIKPHRTTNTTDGAYWYRGAMTFDGVEQQNTLLGEYFLRQTNPVPKNILTGVMAENTTPRMGTVYSVECNEVIDIISHYKKTGEQTEFGEDILQPVYLAKDVACYMTMVLERAERETTGFFVDSLTNLLLPARFTLSPNNTILKKSFVFDNATEKNKYDYVKYRVESIDTSMMDVIYEEKEVEKEPEEEGGEPTIETITTEKYVGVLRCVLTEDKR